MSVAAAAFALAGCQEKDVETFEPNVNEGSTFELYADIAQTKTTLDGYNLEWENGDVIYMVTTDKTWGKPYAEDNDGATIAEFTYNDGMFAPNMSIADGSYTFNAIYTRADQKSYHRAAATSHQLKAIQIQDCANPTAHVKDNDALVGTFTATTPLVEPASVEMNHLYTMMEVDVKNNTGAEIEVVKFEMTATDADLAGVFSVTSFESSTIKTKSGESDKITVHLTGGTVANGSKLPVYFVMAPLSDYSGDVTFRVTDADSKTYTKTVSLNNKSFLAGKYNTTSYTISAADVDPEGASVTWDLSVNKAALEEGNLVTWTSNYANMFIAKGSSQTDANAYLASSDPHTRIYKGHILSVTPADGYAIKKVIYTAVPNHQSNMVNSEWTNAAIGSEDVIITAMSLNGKEISTLIGAATRLTSVKVYYVPENEFVKPTLTGIEVSGQRTEFLSNETFEFDGKVEAIYGEYRADVTDDAEFSVSDTEPEAVLVEGKHEVTVTYGGFEAVYTIVVNASAGVETIVLSAATKPHEDFPEGSAGLYSSASYTIDGYDWTFCPSSDNKFSWYEQGYILWGKKGGYILLPAVVDKRLQSVKILTGTGASTLVQVAVYDENGVQVVSGGEAKTLNAQGAEFSWALTGTDVNTRYQLRVVSAHNAQLQTLTCTYSN